MNRVETIISEAKARIEGFKVMAEICQQNGDTFLIDGINEAIKGEEILISDGEALLKSQEA